MPVSIIDPVNDNKWLEFISSNRQSTIFHHPLWLKVLNKQYSYPVFAICTVNDRNEITAGIPFCEVSALGKTKWISLPFSDYTNPLNCTAGHLNELAEYLTKNNAAKKVNSIEIFWDVDTENHFKKESSFVYHVTELGTDEKSLLNSFHRTKIQGISKSVKQGLTARFATDLKSMEVFYSLHLKTRKKLGVPIQPKRFFHNIYEEIIKNGLGFLILVSKDSRDIAAGLFMGFNDTLTYKYNASDPDFLQLRPNNLIIWTAMQEAIKKSYKYFDFGKSFLENEGLRSFKDGWAAVERPLYYSYFPALPPSNSSFKIIKDKFLAPVIKSSPDFVCKIMGEIAYKYFPTI